MGSFALQIELKNLAIFVAIVVLVASTSSIAAKASKCIDRCGNVDIPFPFGTSEDCYLSEEYFITCNQTFNPPKAFMQNTSIEITSISLDGQLTLLQFIARDCYNPNGSRASYIDPWINFPFFFTVNNTANKFTVIGCDTHGSVSGEWRDRQYKTGCNAMCAAKNDLPADGSCTGLGCCQVSIPKQVWGVELGMNSYSNYSNVKDFNDCGYAFVVEESSFRFYPENLTSLKKVKELPMMVDWAIGNETCEAAKRNRSSYACKSENSSCYKPDNGDGYRCSCLQGYQGNPYLVDGCKDKNECKDPSLNNCEKRCVNKPGGFECVCPKGYHGDGIKGRQGCIRSESLVFKIVAGVALGVIVMLVPTCWLHMKLKRRRVMEMRRKFFLQNGGLLLQEKLITRKNRSSITAIIFSVSELQKATNNFHTSKIIGRGGFGIVYKAMLPDNRLVAIKKSKEVDPRQIEQFINEVIVLSQINHRNVVKLIGCCLETQEPLLVYEFINNGTLSEHIHNKHKASLLSWDMRLRIATETAGVLSYLHSAASTPIIHRDVKSANILLDHTFTSKVSDFGASRLIPLDQAQLSTLVQGTFGYLDPEYIQTNQLSKKSDVYSFGVVLVELLTGRKAVSNDRPEEERSLANFFLSVMKQDRLFQVLEDNVGREGEKEQVLRVGVIAQRCLNVKGEDRPSMKEVAMELERLRVGEEHSTLPLQHITEEDEEYCNGSISGEGNSTSL